MAVTKCRDCDNLVSSRAKTCPYCGANAPAIKWPRLKKALAILLLAVVSLLMLASLLSPPQGEKRIESLPIEIAPVR